MIEKVFGKEREEVLGRFSFYDFRSCSLVSGQEVIIALSEEDETRYCDVCLYPDHKEIRKQYSRRERSMIQVFQDMVAPLREMYLLNDREQWLVNKRIAPQLNKLLRMYGIGDCDATLKVSALPEATAFLKSILRYNTFAFFLFPKEQLVIAPTDHMDIFLFGKDDRAFGHIIEASKNGNGKFLYKSNIVQQLFV